MQILDGRDTEKDVHTMDALDITPSAISLGKVFETGPEAGSDSLMIRHVDGWLRRWEQEATSKKTPFSLPGIPLDGMHGPCHRQNKKGQQNFLGVYLGV